MKKNQEPKNMYIVHICTYICTYIFWENLSVLRPNLMNLNPVKTRFKHETRFKHGLLNRDFYQYLEIWSDAQMEPVISGSTTRFNFFKFGLCSINKLNTPAQPGQYHVFVIFRPETWAHLFCKQINQRFLGTMNMRHHRKCAV